METIKSTNENSRGESYNRKKIEDKHNSRLEMIKEKNQWTWGYINRNDHLKNYKRKLKRLEQDLKYLWDNTKLSNICVIGVLYSKERKEWSWKNFF